LLDLTPDKIAMGLTAYVVLLLSLSVHESAHGWMALQMGDDTAASQGRITLNPLVHIDPIGTVLFPLLMFLGPSGIPLLGWAKPTPVGAHNFRRLARGHILVAGAGPASNILLAILFTAALFVAKQLGVEASRDSFPFMLLVIGVTMNVGLAVFNLVPLPPLDGSWIASWGLPRHIAQHYDRIMEPYGSIILLVLFVTGVLGMVTQPLVAVVQRLLFGLVY
jgi:Zn-dependent protease